MAPEMLRHKYYNSNVDMWSLGVLLYEMLHGHSPFKGYNVHNTMANIFQGDILFDKALKEDTKEVIIAMLNQNFSERPKVCEVLNSVWGRRIQTELSKGATE